MKKMTIREWIFLGVGAVLGLWMAICGGNLDYAQTAPLPPVTYYSPEHSLEPLDVLVLKSTQKTIDLAAFSLTDQAIVDALVDRAAHGVAIRIYLDRGELQAECRGDATCSRIPLHLLLNLPGVQVRVKFSKVLMHLKSYEIDGWYVRDGSANFSEQGESRQDNSATFSTQPAAHTLFDEKFKGMWERPDNLTVAQAVSAGGK